ncbi:Arp2/3 complex subunit, actin nucleation center [Trichoglossum hirsutum]|uniref:Arp2/3 complex subunit, actin nucleation center n=1 Tax=Trichoglossum hirsutum TaxID=265104 RepID=A0A9P8IJ40_9PEZI|nr:Arp2/3 complex subunit, actin nucleation center [Trichoglossum hirsutum]
MSARSKEIPTGRLDGKVAIVTGAGRGIGKGIALVLAERGANLVINYASSAAGAEAVVKEIQALGQKAIAVRADITQPAEITKMFQTAKKEFGRIDFVVSNSGREAFYPCGEVTPEQYDHVFALNTRAQFFVAQEAYNFCEEYGRIVLMSSVAATMKGVKNHALYAGSKAAVEGFTRSFAADCGHKKITVNAIAPGGVKTDMYTENAWHYTPGATPKTEESKLDEGLANFCPLGRVGLPVDIGRVVAFLCSQDGEWVNGKSNRFRKHPIDTLGILLTCYLPFPLQDKSSDSLVVPQHRRISKA